MNPYKLKAIVEFVKSQIGTQPRLDPSWVPDEVLTVFGLDRLLATRELEMVKQELAAIAEADRFMDVLRLSHP